ncbi:CRISPR-associated endonuclease Cas2 [Clostridium carnis]
MFIVLTYDIGEKRINRVRKILKRYITWTQNSVFEGEITEAKLQKCLTEVYKNINKDEDSIYIYRIKNSNNIEKNIIGKEKNYDEKFL